MAQLKNCVTECEPPHDKKFKGIIQRLSNTTRSVWRYKRLVVIQICSPCDPEDQSLSSVIRPPDNYRKQDILLCLCLFIFYSEICTNSVADKTIQGEDKALQSFQRAAYI